MGTLYLKVTFTWQISACFLVFFFFRDSSNESGATDAVSLSMSMSEIEDPEIKGKKKRGRPGKQQLVWIYSKKKV